MAVIACELRDEGASVGMDSKYRRTYTHEYLITAAPGDGMITVNDGALLASPDPLPAMWDPYPFDGGDSFVVLQNRQLKRLSDRQRGRWLCECTWAHPEPGTTSAAPETENPLTRPVKYHLEWAQFTKICEKDKDGNPIVNSVGDLFDPPVEIDDARPVLVAVKNMWPLQDVIDLSVEYKNAVNTDTFYGVTARKAKVESIVGGQVQEENGVKFYSVTLRIQFNEETWDKLLVDRGTQILEFTETDIDGEGTGTATVISLNKVYPRVLSGPRKGEYLDMVNLNADGSQRADNLPALFKTPAYRVYPEKAFSGLGI